MNEYGSSAPDLVVEGFSLNVAVEVDSKRERRELRELVRDSEEIALRNARTVASHQRRMRSE